MKEQGEERINIISFIFFKLILGGSEQTQITGRIENATNEYLRIINN